MIQIYEAQSYESHHCKHHNFLFSKIRRYRGFHKKWFTQSLCTNLVIRNRNRTPEKGPRPWTAWVLATLNKKRMEIINNEIAKFVWGRTWSGQPLLRAAIIKREKYRWLLTDHNPHPCHPGRGLRKEKVIERQMVRGVGENGKEFCPGLPFSRSGMFFADGTGVQKSFTCPFHKMDHFPQLSCHLCFWLMTREFGKFSQTMCLQWKLIHQSPIHVCSLRMA
jgi:hypothetical protein